jgi:hypothetical protein
MDDIDDYDIALLDDDELLDGYTDTQHSLARLATLALSINRLHELFAAELTRRVDREADALTRRLFAGS